MTAWRGLLVLLFCLLISGAATGAASAGGGGGGCYGLQTDEATTSVSLKALCFSPTVVHIESGDTVTWTNRERAPHTVTGVTQYWGSGALEKGDAATFRFDAPGTYPYFCQFHLGMIGAVVVGDGVGPAEMRRPSEAVSRIKSAGMLPLPEERAPSESTNAGFRWRPLGMFAAWVVVVLVAITVLRIGRRGTRESIES
ncbi:MAG: plastocyanin/azurin family copper-binding protein [Actinomycetota bacterium]